MSLCISGQTYQALRGLLYQCEQMNSTSGEVGMSLTYVRVDLTLIANYMREYNCINAKIYLYLYTWNITHRLK